MNALPQEPIRVLLIEDDPADANLLKEMLSQEDRPPFQIESVDQLRTGLKRLAEGQVDVVLLDLTLPDSRGPGTAARMYAQAPSVPIVVLTGLNDDASAIEAVREGAQDYLVKGRVDGPMLSRVMRYAIERKRAEEKLRKAYAELQTAQEELVQAEKLAALGRFSVGVAHEVKNPLGIILGGIELLERDLAKLRPEARIVLEKMEQASWRANVILQGLLQFARPSQAGVKRVEVKGFLEEALSLFKLKAQMGSVELQVRCEEGLSTQVDRNQMVQVLLNLLLNAIDAMPQGGRLEVQAFRAEGLTRFPDGRGCVLEIRDTGVGISSEDQVRLFEPFFTTKRDQGGVGLGLSISRMIVRNHRGDLEIESESGRGTTVRVLLPLDRDK